MRKVFILFILSLSFKVSGQTCDTLIETKSNNIVLTESFYSSNCKKKSYQRVKTNHQKKWDIRTTEIKWNENGKVVYKAKSKTQVEGDWGERRKTIKWIFRINGKFCIKRSKSQKHVSLH
jgi:hypothetical protein